MLVVTAFHPGDAEQAERQAVWILELGKASGHKLLLIADTRCTPELTEKIRAAYAASYDAVELLPFVDHYHSWPKSPNDCFSTAARHIMRTRPQPFLFLEPDSVPLKSGWLDALWAEYQSAGKSFMGDFVSSQTAGINVVDHMSGNGIYPADLFKHAGLLLIADEVAFDVTAASQIVPQMHKTKLIHHQWKAPPFESWAQVEERIRPEAVLFHANKDGSLIKLLREKRKEGDASCRTLDSPVSSAVPKFNPDSTADIFIKTYPADYPWLKYCAGSISKFATGFRKTVIISPTTCPNLSVYMFEWQERMEYGGGNIPDDGYLSQQVFKLYADTFTDADFILFTDSDTIFTRPVTPETYFTDGKVNWMITPYAKTETPWQPMIEKFLGRPVEFETMRRHPQMVPRWLLKGMRDFCEDRHKMPLDQYVMSQPYREFSEFNALGAFAYYVMGSNFFNWINTEEVPAEQWPELTVLQKYSHDGLTPEIEAEFSQILNTPALNGIETFTDTVASIPMCSLIDDAQDLASRLKTLCSSNAETRRIRRILHDAGVIKLDYLYTKRKGWKRKKK